jgi:CBS domain-containing protein
MIDKKPPCRPHEGKKGMAQLVRDVMTPNPVDLPPMAPLVEVEAVLA